MMNIVMVAPVPPPYGGIGNWVLLLDSYVENKENVNFIHVNTAPKSRGLDGRSLWDRVVSQGITMITLSKQLKQILKNEKIDAVHITTSGQLAVIRDIFMLKIAKKFNVNSVYHIRFGRIPEIANRNTIEWKLIKKAMELADYVIAIDKQTENSIAKKCCNVDIVNIPNPFDIEKISGITPVSGSKRVVFVGWIVKTKGIEELLEAWRRIHSQFSDWMLQIVGPCSEEYMDYLKSNYSIEGVVFEGEKENSEALRIMGNADCFVLPSYTEGFPNAVLEAMALCKPIIASDVGAIPEMLEHCGIVIPKMDSKALEEALTRVIGNEELRVELGTAAKLKLYKEYSIDSVFPMYKKIWSKGETKW